MKSKVFPRTKDQLKALLAAVAHGYIRLSKRGEDEVERKTIVLGGTRRFGEWVDYR